MSSASIAACSPVVGTADLPAHGAIAAIHPLRARAMTSGQGNRSDASVTLSGSRAETVAELLARPFAGADPLRPILASLIAGRAHAEGVLPARLGLSPTAFEALWRDYFPGPRLRLENGGAGDIPELEDLVGLLLEHRAGAREAESWLGHIVAWGCAGRQHLWHDLGLANRGELSALMQIAFPSLAALNTGDMKWKKFLYRHYCQRDGIYVCPAPSCAECTGFSQCFGPEE